MATRGNLKTSYLSSDGAAHGVDRLILSMGNSGIQRLCPKWCEQPLSLDYLYLGKSRCN